MPSEHDVRQRASICQDCWFWKEMSCALASPESGVCANRRPVHGRRAQAAAPAQAQLVPLAAGHGSERLAPAAQAPFGERAPEATFSLTEVRSAPVTAGPAVTSQLDMDVRELRSAPPSFREIRSGRAAAAARTPVAEVRIPVDEVEGVTADLGPSQTALPGMDQLVERVRMRTAARLSRSMSPA